MVSSVIRLHASVTRGLFTTKHLVSALVLLSTACMGQTPSQTPTAQTSDELVTFTVPSVKAVEAGSETQQKKQVIVSLVPTAFMISDQPTKECVNGQEESKGLMSLVNVNNGQTPKKPYVITTRTGMDYFPKTLSFKLRITNHSEKVMRLGEIYLKVNINSQEVEVSTLDLDSVKHGVLLKGESKDFTISVPSWNKNSPEATVDFSLQNVPAELDQKGAVLDVGEFSWTFKAQNETKQANTKKTVENLMLDAAEASNMQCHPGALAAN